MGPGGPPGLQNRAGRRKSVGGFDSLPSPPSPLPLPMPLPVPKCSFRDTGSFRRCQPGRGRHRHGQRHRQRVVVARCATAFIYFSTRSSPPSPLPLPMPLPVPKCSFRDTGASGAANPAEVAAVSRSRPIETMSACEKIQSNWVGPTLPMTSELANTSAVVAIVRVSSFIGSAVAYYSLLLRFWPIELVPRAPVVEEFVEIAVVDGLEHSAELTIA